MFFSSLLGSDCITGRGEAAGRLDQQTLYFPHRNILGGLMMTVSSIIFFSLSNIATLMGKYDLALRNWIKIVNKA